MDFIVGSTSYLIIKSLHVIAVITWMAGLFYLPRLFVYHAQEQHGSPTAATLAVMAAKLHMIIIRPSFIVVWATGILLLTQWVDGGWVHLKATLVILLSVFQWKCGRWRLALANGTNTHDHRFYRKVNEVPTLLLLVIVPLVIFKPF